MAWPPHPGRPRASRPAWLAALVVPALAAGCHETPPSRCDPPSRAPSSERQETRPADYLPGFGLETFASDLPVLVIDTAGAPVVDEPKVEAALAIHEDGRPGEAPHRTVEVGIELRGAFSLAIFPKKQFGIAVRGSPAALLGLPTAEDWVLNGTFGDATVLRNRLGYELARGQGRWAPRSVHAEVFLDVSGTPLVAADYLGVFLLAERVQVAPSRLELAEGGWLVELTDPTIVWPDEPWLCGPRSGKTVVILHPSGEALDAAAHAGIRDDLVALEERLYDGELDRLASWVDLDAFTDYLLLQEFLRNDDAFRRSFHVHRDAGGPVTLGPIWDLDLASGAAEGQTVAGFTTPGRPWADAFLGLAELRDRLVTRWAELRAGAWSSPNLEAWLAAERARLEPALERNEQRWQMLAREGAAAVPRPYPATVAGELDRLHDWLLERAAWLDANLGAIGPAR